MRVPGDYIARPGGYGGFERLGDLRLDLSGNCGRHARACSKPAITQRAARSWTAARFIVLLEPHGAGDTRNLFFPSFFFEHPARSLRTAASRCGSCSFPLKRP